MCVLFLARKREVQEGKFPHASFIPILLGTIACIKEGTTDDVLKAFNDPC